MDPQNPLFYVSTFVTNNAAGLAPPSQMTLDTLVSDMADACYGSFQPDRCSVLAGMVGRIRTQDACLAGGNAYNPQPLGWSAAGPISGQAALAAASVPPGGGAPVVNTATLASALATIGTLPGPSTTLARCG
jgi:hypothetical protein